MDKRRDKVSFNLEFQIGKRKVNRSFGKHISIWFLFGQNGYMDDLHRFSIVKEFYVFSSLYLE